MSNPKDTFVRPQADSVDSARKLYSPDKIKLLTKSQIQLYIQSFFDRDGTNFNLLQAVSPRFINYNIDKSFDPATDPTQRRLQVARYFNELRGILPCILVVDAGVNPDPQTIGLVSEAAAISGNWNGIFPVTRWLPLTIIAGARDLGEVDDLASVLSLMFNELRNIAGGSAITGRAEAGETWVISLPNGGVAITSPSELAIADDPIDKIWYVQATINVYFETAIRLKAPLPEFTELVPFIDTSIGRPIEERPVPIINVLYGATRPQKGKQVFDAYKPVIIGPDSISVNSQTTLLLQNFQEHYTIFVSDPTIATLSPDLVLTPRRPGTVAIRIFDTTKATHPARANILAEKVIKIV
jgi:hypothetical protein